MTAKRRKSARAFTLVEVMGAILILLVAALGASAYRYHAALDTRKAAAHAGAARVCLLLCESWRGVKGIETYNPTTHFGSDLAITTITETGGLEYQYKGAGFTLLGGYTVVANGIDYYALLSWKDIGTGLRALNVVVAWSPVGQSSTTVDYYAYKNSFKLTTYTSN